MTPRRTPSPQTHGIQRHPPQITWPTIITLARIALVLPFIYLMLHLSDPAWHGLARPLAVAVYAVMAISDFLDGYLARRLQLQSRLGALLDPVADKLAITAALILLCLDATRVAEFKIPDWVLIVALGKDVLTLVGVLVLYLLIGHAIARPNLVGKATTTAELVLVLWVLALPVIPPAVGLGGARLLCGLVAVLAAATLVTYVRDGLHILRTHPAGPVPPGPPAS